MPPIKALRQAKSIETVYNSAYWHLAQQDYTISEIRNKLARKTENQDWIETVINDLIDKNYLKSDFDFSMNFALAKFRNQLGPNAIKQKLKQRGIAEQQISSALEQLIDEHNIDPFELALERLRDGFQDFSSTSKEKLFAQLNRQGFSSAQISYALEQHPAKNTLKSNLEVKADKADLTNEIMKLYRKGKGKKLIEQELKSRLIKLDEFTETIQQLESDEQVDFYQSCLNQLNKKRYQISNPKEKTKAYAYLSRRGFSSDEIKEAFSAALEE